MNVTDEDSGDDEKKVSVEYTPVELIGILQLLDYLDMMMLQEGMPLGIIAMQREKILDAMMKEDIKKNLDNEREERREEYDEMFSIGDDDIDLTEGRSGFQ